jgi:hypothetical protein
MRFHHPPDSYERCRGGDGVIERILTAEASSIEAYECTAADTGGVPCCCVRCTAIGRRSVDPVDEELPWRAA